MNGRNGIDSHDDDDDDEVIAGSPDVPTSPSPSDAEIDEDRPSEMVIHSVDDLDGALPSPSPSPSSSTRWRLTNPKRIGFIFCALLLFVVMTLIILLQLSSSRYSIWKSYGANGMRDGLYVSPSDDMRRFEVISLWNGLEVLLIEDPLADKAAAAMDLGVGSSLDPSEYLGLAHFHEHMLFLGSHRYPKEDAFSSLISMNGGRDNAFTENEATNFFFEVDSEHLEEALDVWSRFFIDPLLSAKWMDKEENAVDAEYKKDIPSQQWRDWRMLEVAANPLNPFHRFTVGSIESLTKSETKGHNVYHEMVQFHRKWVKAQIMKLVVVGKEDLSTLRKWVEHKFNKVPSDKTIKSQLEEIHKSRPSAFRIGHETGMRFFVEPISQQKQITYFWSISGLDLFQSYRSPVLQLINSHLLESAANGALFDVLKNRLMFIEGIETEVFYDEKEWSGNSISFELTSAGEQNVDLVTFYLLKYINLLLVTAQNEEKLDRVYKSYFEESKCMDSVYFEHYALLQREAYHTVSGLAKRMQYRETSDLLYLQLDAAPQRLQFNLTKLIGGLQWMADPQRLIIQYSNHKFDKSMFNEKEKYFGIRFRRERIPKQLMAKWTAIDPFADDDGTTESLMIPPLNPLILDQNGRCNFEGIKLLHGGPKHVKSTEKNQKKQEKVEVPELIVNEQSINVWYLGDAVFGSPRINVNMLLVSPLIYQSGPIKALFAELWLHFVGFYSSEWVATRSAAAYGVDLSLNHQGMVLSVTSLSEKHLDDVIVDYLRRYLLGIQDKIQSQWSRSLKVLHNALVALSKTYRNLKYQPVWSQSKFAIFDVVKRPHFNRQTMLNLVTKWLNIMSSPKGSGSSKLLRGIIEFIDEVLSHGFLVESLFHGNLKKETTLHLVDAIRQSGLKLVVPNGRKGTHFRDQLIRSKHLKLDMNINGVRKRQFVFQRFNTNDKDTNDVVQIWYQIGAPDLEGRSVHYNRRNTVKLLLLANMMKSACFRVLRTEESLGYVATAFSASSPGETNNVDYLVLMVASDHKSGHYLHQRVEHFVSYYFNEVLLPMKKEKESKKFALFVNGTVSDLKQKEVRLSQHTALLWDEMMGHQYRFEWKREFIEILRTLSVEELIAFYREHVLGQNAKWISIQLFHQKQKSKLRLAPNRGFGHWIVADDADKKGILYFNETKDLQNLGYAQYFDVF